MLHKSLGRTGESVFCLGLGCMGMSDFYGSPDEAEAKATLKEAFASGVDFLDTADMYGVGRNEELIGEVIREVGAKPLIGTKFGYVRKEDGQFMGIRGDAKYVKDACERSLKRLKVDVIDVYYQHEVDRSVPISETVGAMSRLVEEGKVRFLGLSKVNLTQVDEALSVHPIAAVQLEFSLWSPQVGGQAREGLHQRGISLVAYSPLGRGFLGGAIRTPSDLTDGDRRTKHPRFQGTAFADSVDLCDRLATFAELKGVSLPQLCLAWVLAQGDRVIPIPGTKKRKYLQENLQAAHLCLSPDEVKSIQQLIDGGKGKAED